MISIPFLSKKKGPRTDLYIGIFFKEQEGVVMYFEDIEGKLRITATENFTYSDGWEHLVDDVDETIYRLETRTKLAPQQTIFFVYSHLVDPKSHQIKRPFLMKIKELSKSLDLKPMGYIECQEAVIDHIKASQMGPVHMLVMEFDKTVVTASLYQGGKHVYQETVSRAGDIMNVLNPLLGHMKAEYELPPHITIYDAPSIADIQSALVGNRWTPGLFSAQPSIEIMTESMLLKSLSAVFARQIHGESVLDVPDIQVEDVEARRVEHKTPIEEVDADSIDEPLESVHNVREAPSELMGFVIGDEGVDDGYIHEPDHKDVYQDDQEPDLTTQQVSTTSHSRPKLIKPKVAFKLPTIKMPKIPAMGPFMGVIIVMVILGALVSFEYFIHRATVNVSLPSSMINRDVEVPSDLKLEKASDSQSVEDTQEASGSKQIGDRARGTVTIYNSNLKSSASLSKGTKLTGPSGLIFILSDDVKVASASGDASDITSSTTKASVAASDIGSEYNISSGAKLTISGQSASDVIAKADSAFAGGSKKQVQAISKDDIAKLRTKVMNAAKSRAASTISQKAGQGRVVISDLTEVVLDSEKYSHKAGDEASSVSLSATAQITYYTYDDMALKKQFSLALDKGGDSAHRIQPESLTYKVKSVDQATESAKVTFAVSGRRVPVIDISAVSSASTARPVPMVQQSLISSYKAQAVDVEQSPRIPGILWTPIFKKNITIKIDYK